MKDIEKTIGKLIDKSNTSIISSIDDEGYPNTKAMLKVREREGIKHLYFSTNTSSMRVSQYKKNPKACVYFYDKNFYQGIMLKGTMEVLEDIETKKRIWKFGDTLYYKEGVTDPDYCVLKFTATNGRYYKSFESENFDIN